MIVQHEGKLTMKQIEQISSEGEVLNNYYYSNRFPTLRAWWSASRPWYKSILPRDDFDVEFESNARIHGSEIAMKFGTPNCHMKEYESYPGAWVFYDKEADIRWLVFSDGIRKNHFKGTSYEVTIPDSLTEEQFKMAIRKFFAHFGYVPNEET